MKSPDPARLILPAIRWADETGFSHAEDAIAEALELGVGGFIVFGGPTDEVRTLTANLRTQAGRPLLIGADLERGAGQQFAGLTELPPPLALASLDDPDAIREAGAITAQDALSVGVNWVFAPVADLDLAASNPIVQTRSFGDDPAAVGDAVRRWIEGCQGTGALACAKHYPGHGRTTTDSHAGLPVVEADAMTLDTVDRAPFAAAVAAGVAGVMTAHVAYPALDLGSLPATLSSVILGGLRTDLGFDGVIVTDAMIMDGAFVGRSEGAAYVQAVAAGVDLLLYPKQPRAARDALVAAIEDGTLATARVADALARYDRLLARAPQPGGGAPAPGDIGRRLADRLVARGLVRGEKLRLRQPIDLVVVDDDIGGPYPASPSDWTAAALESEGIELGPGGSRVVLAFAEPRAWKGRGGFGRVSRDRLLVETPMASLIVLFAHPRLMSEIPSDAPLVHAWHRQRPMQEAVARWIASRL
ncbi:MAG TPA: glycoside hydrolase family 3 N-terminal domain-containing protein [Gemmatimonadales bacterium]|nr:glycoside hydrolase family 3 N-terminal domain-containing protein [Gemmatimonadales bacterium]